MLQARGSAPDAELTARVRHRKHELLAYLSSRDGGGRASAHPASFSQESHWTLHRTAPDSPAYHIFVAAQIHASAIDRVEQIVPLLASRHALLRTTYRLAGDRVEALTWDTLTVPVERVSVDDRTVTGVIAVLGRFADRPFNLEREPPLRIALVEPTEEDASAYLAIVAHHIAADYRAVQILLEELEHGFREGLTSPQRAPANDGHRYASFARRQRTLLRSAEGAALLQACCEDLRGTLPVFEFPSDAPRPGVQVYSGARLARTLDAAQTAAVRAAARRFGVTPFVLLLTLFSRVLTRYSGHDELIVGVPVSLRSDPDVSDCVGDFVNTIPLRVRFGPAVTVAECIDGVRDAFHRAYQRAQVPFAEIVRELRLPRDPSRAPLCQVLFVWHQGERHPPRREERPRLTLDVVASEQRGAPVDLMLVVDDEGDTLTCQFHYATAVLHEPEVARVAGNFEAVIRAAVAAHAHASAVTLDVLNERESARLRDMAFGPRREGPFQSFRERVESIAASRPSAPAIRYRGLQLTYAELDQRAAGVAAAIGRLSKRGDAPVAVYGTRGPEMLIAMLGAHKAGAAYVPIDSLQVWQRVAYMLRDAGVCAVLSDRERPPELRDVPCEWIELSSAAVPTPPATDLPATAGALAYTIYTSGTTGRPKGVQIPQDALSNFIDAMAHEPGLKPTDVVLALAPLGFDLSVHEVIVPLAVGATVIIADDETRRDGRAILDLIARERVTFVTAAVSTWRLMLAAGWQAPLDIRAASGAEPLPRELAMTLARRTSVLWNLYGPTESTVWCSAYRFDEARHRTLAFVPVGSPIQNHSLHILDRSLRRIPIGGVGEVCIGGRGLATGYVNRPDLTQQAFVPHSEDGLTLYRTGDLGRVLDDGTVMLFGRADNQIKLRGFRIECGEVESALRSLGDIEDVVVLKRVSAAGEEQLVAHVIAAPGVTLDTASLRECLRAILPSYMIPSRFVLELALPLTANGKIDRRALANAPVAAEAVAWPATAAPLTPLETTLAALWTEVFAREVPVDDDFLLLGGTSLMAVRLAERIRAATGQAVRPALIFEHGTVHKLAAHLAAFPARPELTDEDETWIRDAVAPLRISMNGLARPVVPPRTILLTGATGFLGLHVVRALLDRADVRVLCLVRETSQELARARLERQAVMWRVSGLNWRRVELLCGDLETPGFGLDRNARLSVEEADAIVHCGAVVNFAYPYERLRAANVDSTRELIAIAARGRVKPLHYVSTYSVVDPLAAFVPEQPSVPRHPRLNLGYTRSKWVAEQVLDASARQGLPVVIYRPSRMVGCPATGAVNPVDLFSRLLRAVTESRQFPEDAGFDNFVTVDYCANIIASRTLSAAASSRVVHLVAPEWERWSTIAVNLRRLGHTLTTLPFDEWMKAMRQASHSGAITSVDGVLSFLSGPGRDLRLALRDRHPAFETRAARDIAGRADGKSSAISEAALAKYLDFMAEFDVPVEQSLHHGRIA